MSLPRRPGNMATLLIALITIFVMAVSVITVAYGFAWLIHLAMGAAQ